jgi:hypothetical protein
VDLRETGVAEEGAAFIRPPTGGDVGPLGIRRKIKNVAVSAGGENHRVGHMDVDVPGCQIAGHNATRTAVDNDQVEHLGAWQHLHAPRIDLPLQRLIGSQQQLLACLALGVEGA